MADPAYRIIYNWDGAPHHYDEYPGTIWRILPIHPSWPVGSTQATKKLADPQ